MGVEVEFFSIRNDTFSHRVIKPKKHLREKGEKFTSDPTIGTEYNSKVFYSVREAFFLLKSSLRKYQLRNYHHTKRSGVAGIAFHGSWADKAAGTHIHIGIGRKDISKKKASEIANYIHDHLPFIIAVSTNSPVWEYMPGRISSSRMHYTGEDYCMPTLKGKLETDHHNELNFNNYIGKDSTLEIRICDSNIPEFICASLLIINVLANASLRKRRQSNILTDGHYLAARKSAIKHGAKSMLYWNNKPVTFAKYIDNFFNYYRHDIKKLDVPDQIFDVFRYLKKGYNGSTITKRSCTNLKRKHPRAWKRYFARRYAIAIEELLNGQTLKVFASHLGVRLPNVEKVRLGRYVWK